MFVPFLSMSWRHSAVAPLTPLIVKLDLADQADWVGISFFSVLNRSTCISPKVSVLDEVDLHF